MDSEHSAVDAKVLARAQFNSDNNKPTFLDLWNNSKYKSGE